MFNLRRHYLILAAATVLLAACVGPATSTPALVPTEPPSATPVPPTDTAVPPTATPLPPTATPVPPADTPAPTVTLKPRPTNTKGPRPTPRPSATQAPPAAPPSDVAIVILKNTFPLSCIIEFWGPTEFKLDAGAEGSSSRTIQPGTYGWRAFLGGAETGEAGNLDIAPGSTCMFICDKEQMALRYGCR